MDFHGLFFDSHKFFRNTRWYIPSTSEIHENLLKSMKINENLWKSTTTTTTTTIATYLTLGEAREEKSVAPRNPRCGRPMWHPYIHTPRRESAEEEFAKHACGHRARLPIWLLWAYLACLASLAYLAYWLTAAGCRLTYLIFVGFCVKVVANWKKSEKQALEWGWTSIRKAADPLQLHCESRFSFIFMICARHFH